MRLSVIYEKKTSEKKKLKDKEFHSAVGIVQCGNKYLLGLAKSTGDDRSGNWVFPGGHIKLNEKPTKAAVREVFEETGITCKSVGEPIKYDKKKNVAFVHCKANKGQDLNHNHEFSAIGFFTKLEMRSLKLYHNVLELLNKIK